MTDPVTVALVQDWAQGALSWMRGWTDPLNDGTQRRVVFYAELEGQVHIGVQDPFGHNAERFFLVNVQATEVDLD